MRSSPFGSPATIGAACSGAGDGVVGEHGAEPVDDRLHEGAEVERLDRHDEAAVVEQREVEQILDHGAQRTGVGGDPLGEVAPLLVAEAIPAGGQERREPSDGGGRGAQLVRRRAQEHRLEAVELAEPLQGLLLAGVEGRVHHGGGDELAQRTEGLQLGGVERPAGDHLEQRHAAPAPLEGERQGVARRQLGRRLEHRLGAGGRGHADAEQLGLTGPVRSGRERDASQPEVIGQLHRHRWEHLGEVQGLLDERRDVTDEPHLVTPPPRFRVAARGAGVATTSTRAAAASAASTPPTASPTVGVDHPSDPGAPARTRSDRPSTDSTWSGSPSPPSVASASGAPSSAIVATAPSGVWAATRAVRSTGATTQPVRRARRSADVTGAPGWGPAEYTAATSGVRGPSSSSRVVASSGPPVSRARSSARGHPRRGAIVEREERRTHGGGKGAADRDEPDLRGARDRRRRRRSAATLPTRRRTRPPRPSRPRAGRARRPGRRR